MFVHADWIDEDTPAEGRQTRPLGLPGPPEYAEIDTYDLVFSDEFNVDGRDFSDGSDPKWTALNKNDYTNGALHYYTPKNVHTRNGDLIIQSKAEKTKFVGVNDTSLEKAIFEKTFTSAMLQTWNKFCFTGGIIEAEIELPGDHETTGLWPAFWLLGNIARHTYVGSTNHVWPWSSNECTDASRSAQKISGCTNTQHYGMKGRFGRGAPEIDIFEVQAGTVPKNEGIFRESPVGQPFMSNSFQVAPGRSVNRPPNGRWPGPGQWYEGLRGGDDTGMNIFFYGDYNHFRGDPDTKDYWSDAVSFNTQLDHRHFEKKFRYRVEWELPDEKKETDGYIRWYINDKFVLDINGTGIVEAGNGATISTEPMYIIMNTAISTQWGFGCYGGCPCQNYDCTSTKWRDNCGFPWNFCKMMNNKTAIPEYKANWVRVYQNSKDEKQKVGCSTPERPTKKYIEANEGLYKTANDAKPLKPIAVGKGACKKGAKGRTKDACGGPKQGSCNSGSCTCEKGWIGPNCLVQVAFDPIIWEREDKFDDLEFTGPMWGIKGIWTGLVVMAGGLLLLAFPFIQTRIDRWSPVHVQEL